MLFELLHSWQTSQTHGIERRGSFCLSFFVKSRHDADAHSPNGPLTSTEVGRSVGEAHGSTSLCEAGGPHGWLFYCCLVAGAGISGRPTCLSPLTLLPCWPTKNSSFQKADCSYASQLRESSMPWPLLHWLGNGLTEVLCPSLAMLPCLWGLQTGEQWRGKTRV